MSSGTPVTLFSSNNNFQRPASFITWLLKYNTFVWKPRQRYEQKIVLTKFEGHSLARTRSIAFSNFPLIHLSVNLAGLKGRCGKKNIQTNVWKIRKINWAPSIQPTLIFFKLGEYNLLPGEKLLLSILTLRFINCVNISFGKVICHRILIQTLKFPIASPSRQDGAENRDKAYSSDI